MGSAPWVVMADGGGFLCAHCGAQQPMALPCDADVYDAALRAFLEKHRHCPKPKEAA